MASVSACECDDSQYLVLRGDGSDSESRKSGLVSIITVPLSQSHAVGSCPWKQSTIETEWVCGIVALNRTAMMLLFRLRCGESAKETAHEKSSVTYKALLRKEI
jgi:hypothetical protein